MEKVYKHFMKQSKHRFRKRVLIEMSQKYTLECTRKASSRYVVGGDRFCPHRLHVGDRFFTTNSRQKQVPVVLSRAHVGMRRSEIIDQVLVENPELDLYELTKKVLEKHLDPSISVVIACQTCNKKLECVRGVEKTTK